MNFGIILIYLIVTPQSESRTCDNYRMPLSRIQIPGSPSTDPKGTIDNHCPFENLTYIRLYNQNNYNFLKVENPTKILAKFRLKNKVVSPI